MSTFGTVFRVTTFGESHCSAVGAIVDGCPPLLELTEALIQPQLDRRRPGQSTLTTPRVESDTVKILSGTEDGLTLGTPIGLLVPNENRRPVDYANMMNIPRPGHADYSYHMKYGIHASSGGGRSSARETIGRVAAGTIAENWLRKEFGTEIVTFVSSVGTIDLPDEKLHHPSGRPWTRSEVDANGTLVILRDPSIELPGLNASTASKREFDDAYEQFFVSRISDPAFSSSFPAYVDSSDVVYAPDGTPLLETSAPSSESLQKMRSTDVVCVRCPDASTACRMATEIRLVKSEHDSVGGVLTTIVTKVPIGLGEPVFDKLEAKLAHAMLSIPATKGFEIGEGFQSARMRGSAHNDPFRSAAPLRSESNEPTSAPDSTASSTPLLRTVTNHAGGTLGGVSSGADLRFRVAIKPVSTISIPQQTVDMEGRPVVLEAKGRHDACVLPRAPPLVEAMCALVLIDAVLLQRARTGVNPSVLPDEDVF